MERYDVNKPIKTLTVLKQWVERAVESASWTGRKHKVYVLGVEGEELEIEKYVVYNKCNYGWYRVVLCLLDEDDVAYCDMTKNGDYIGYVQNVYGYGDYWKWGWGVIEDANI